jgi:hypothetical protein
MRWLFDLRIRTQILRAVALAIAGALMGSAGGACTNQRLARESDQPAAL